MQQLTIIQRMQGDARSVHTVTDASLQLCCCSAFKWTWQWGSINPSRHFCFYWWAICGGGLCCRQTLEEWTCPRTWCYSTRTPQMCNSPSRSFSTFHLFKCLEDRKNAHWLEGRNYCHTLKGQRPKIWVLRLPSHHTPVISWKVFAHVILARI